MVLQTLIILFLSSWLVEEYLNNIYLQAYINDTVQANAVLIAIVVTIGVLGLSVGLLKVLRSTHKQIGALVNEPEEPGMSIGSPVVASSPKPTVDLHPMVAALKADLAHQGSMEPLPPLQVKDAPAPEATQATPAPAPTKSLTGTPSTVITGTMPVLKRANPDQNKT